MQLFDYTATRACMAFVLVAANTGLWCLGMLEPPRDKGALLSGTTYRLSDDGVEGAVTDAVTHNAAIMDSFVSEVTAAKGVLFLGTSESDRWDNLACFMNGLGSPHPWTSLAKGGLSPIHASVLLARVVARGGKLPPTAYIVNPVYFSLSHDRVDDGWLSQVARTVGFVAFDDWGLRKHMDPEAWRLLRAHTHRAQALDALRYQQHVAHRWFLRIHGTDTAPLPPRAGPRCVDAVKEPGYDEKRNVRGGYEPRDGFLQHRWRMSEETESVNLVGMRNLVHVWQAVGAPLMLVMIPPNRRFYEAEGLDMGDYNRRVSAVFGRIEKLADVYRGSGEVIVANLDRVTDLVGGYADRMHPSRIGNLMIAKALRELPSYKQFVRATVRYYEEGGGVVPPRGQATP